MNAQQFWNIDNVSSFRNFTVHHGEIDISYSEYRDYLTEIWGTVEVCGQTFDQGSLFEDADPTAFRIGLSEYESELQSELEDQLNREDSDDIEFKDGDEFELSEEDEEEGDDE
ncbi:hypothetical protein MT_57064 [Pseudomonas phage phiPto-bp6g]|nr:hypothetical protein MT_57064 [Pseudomonas phage phiPto-bp6g]